MLGYERPILVFLKPTQPHKSKPTNATMSSADSNENGKSELLCANVDTNKVDTNSDASVKDTIKSSAIPTINKNSSQDATDCHQNGT